MRRMRKRMQILVMGWIGLGLIASAAPARTQAQPAPAGKPGAVVVEMAEIKAKVDAVDYGKRLVTLTGPEGRTRTLKVDPSVKRFKEVYKGDEVVVRVIEAFAISVNKP